MFDKVIFPESAEEQNIAAYKFLLGALIESNEKELKEEAEREYHKYFDIPYSYHDTVDRSHVGWES